MGKQDHGSASVPWHNTPPVLLSSVHPSPGTLLSPVFLSVCAHSLERRGAGGVWGPAAVGLQGGPCHGRSEFSLPKPGLPGGREPSRVRPDHCSTLNPQPARAAAGREETESHGGEEVAQDSAPEALLSPVSSPVPFLSPCDGAGTLQGPGQLKEEFGKLVEIWNTTLPVPPSLYDPKPSPAWCLGCEECWGCVECRWAVG